MDRIKKHVKKTMRQGVMGGLGGFGGMFDLVRIRLRETSSCFRNGWCWNKANACDSDGSA